MSKCSPTGKQQYNTETQKHRNTETQKHRNTETQKHRNTETQKHRNTETQKHRNTETQKHRNTVMFALIYSGYVQKCHTCEKSCLRAGYLSKLDSEILKMRLKNKCFALKITKTR